MPSRPFAVVILLAACNGGGSASDDTAATTEVDFDNDGDGYTSEEGDCNDLDADINPDATESCNELDDNCDGAIDEGVRSTWYQDADGDSFGNPDASLEACTQPVQMVADATDCDDLNALVMPGADELCNGLDDDCDGSVDEEAIDGGPWYADTDGDGYGDAESVSTTCDPTSDTVDDATDCDDGDADVFPGSTALETPGDGVDTDCDGVDACTDANCDGQPDIFAVGYWDTSGGYSTAEIWQYGGPDFLDADRLELTGLGGWNAKTADLNLDGYPDLVTANTYSGSRYTDSHVYWGSASGYSDGSRTDLPTIGVVRVLVEDIDADGWPDLFFANASSGGNRGFVQDSYVYWGSASGFSTSDRTDLPTLGAWEAEIEDLDDDGQLDLVICNYYEDDVGYYEVDSVIYWGDSSRFANGDSTGLATAGCRDVEAADLDGDGLLDLAFANSSDNTGAWQIDSPVYFNDGARFANPDTTWLPTSFSFGMEAGDADGDGDIDLIYASLWGESGYEAESYVYLNEGGSFSSEDSCPLPTMGAYSLYLEDLNGDGYSELVVPSSWDDTWVNETMSQVFWGSDAGFCACDVTELPTLAPGKASFGDLNGDGYTDIAFPSPSYEVYDSESVIYWGDEWGYDEADATWFASDLGTWAAPLIVGG